MDKNSEPVSKKGRPDGVTAQVRALQDVRNVDGEEGWGMAGALCRRFGGTAHAPRWKLRTLGDHRFSFSLLVLVFRFVTFLNLFQWVKKTFDVLRGAIIKKLLWKSFIKRWPPTGFVKTYFFTVFLLKFYWIFVNKTKDMEAWNRVDSPPPFMKLFHNLFNGSFPY